MDELIKSTVFISNEAINARYDYTPGEVDLMVQIMYELSRQKNLTPGMAASVELTYQQLVKARELSGNSIYDQVKKAIKGLLSKPYEIYDKELNAVICTNFIASSIYYQGKGVFQFSISASMVRILVAVNKEFTTFEMHTLLKLKSKYSKRFYMMLHQFKRTGVRFCNLDELRTTFKVGDKYEKYSEFCRRVLDPAVAEINEHSELKVSYEPTLRKGKKIDQFEIIVLLKKEIAEITGDEKQKAKMRYFGLSDWQIDNICFTLEPRRIAQVLYAMNIHQAEIKNKGAYLAKLFETEGVFMKGKLNYSKQLSITDEP